MLYLMQCKPTSRRYHYRCDSGAALLIDIVVAVAIFTLLFGGILNTLQRIASAQIENKSRLAALFLMSSQIEKARSLPYASIGTTTGGTVVGTLLASEAITENNLVFTRTTSVIYKDDAHDGLAGADTNAKPNDYKQITVTVAWNNKASPRSVRISTFITPPLIEP
jgi:type II secretory pathway pseudopilin PulG